MNPPFLRLQEGDVRNLENVLTDVAFFDTQFVLIHGGVFQFYDGAYLAMKPHVWADLSAMPFLFSVPACWMSPKRFGSARACFATTQPVCSPDEYRMIERTSRGASCCEQVTIDAKWMSHKTPA